MCVVITALAFWIIHKMFFFICFYAVLLHKIILKLDFQIISLEHKNVKCSDFQFIFLPHQISRLTMGISMNFVLKIVLKGRIINIAKIKCWWFDSTINISF